MLGKQFEALEQSEDEPELTFAQRLGLEERSRRDDRDDRDMDSSDDSDDSDSDSDDSEDEEA